MSPDQLLGRDFCFRNSDGLTVVLQTVTVVAISELGAVRLVGAGFTPAWVDKMTWNRLLATGVLRDC